MPFKKQSKNTNTDVQGLGGFNPADYQSQQGIGVQPQNNGSQPQQGVGVQPPNSGNQQIPSPKRKRKFFPIVLCIVAILAVTGVGVFVAKFFLSNSERVEEPEAVYETTGRYALDNLLSALNVYNPETIDSLVGTEDGDSYIAQEWAYVNGVKLREEFITKVCSLVKFAYPNDLMNNGEAVKVTHPD